MQGIVEEKYNCKHCKDTWYCQQSELKKDKKKFKIWNECPFCGKSEHLKYTGSFGMINDIPQKYINKLKEKKIICRCQQKEEIKIF